MADYLGADSSWANGEGVSPLGGASVNVANYSVSGVLPQGSLGESVSFEGGPQYVELSGSLSQEGLSS